MRGCLLARPNFPLRRLACELAFGTSKLGMEKAARMDWSRFDGDAHAAIALASRVADERGSGRLSMADLIVGIIVIRPDLLTEYQNQSTDVGPHADAHGNRFNRPGWTY